MTIEEMLMVMSGDLGWLMFMVTVNTVVLCIAVFVMVIICGRIERRIDDLKRLIRNRY